MEGNQSQKISLTQDKTTRSMGLWELQKIPQKHMKKISKFCKLVWKKISEGIVSFLIDRAFSYIVGLIAGGTFFSVVSGLVSYFNPALWPWWCTILIVYIPQQAAVYLYIFRDWLIEKEKKEQSKMYNPGISIENEDDEYEIFKDRRCLRKNTVVIKALQDGVSQFRRSSLNTGARIVKIKIEEGGQLFESDEEADELAWFVAFAPLPKGDTHRIVFRMEVENFQSFLRKHLASTFSTVKLRVVFAKKLIIDDEVSLSIKDGTTGKPLIKITDKKVKLNDCTDGSKKEAIWEFGTGKDYPSIADGVYLMSWKWR